MTLLRCGLSLTITMLGWAGVAGQAKKDDKVPDKVSYYKDVRPIFQQHCQGCHQPAKAQGGYVMTGYAELLQKTEHDLIGVVPGQPGKSELYRQIVAEGGKPAKMPRGKDPLSDREVKLIERWIAQGATDDTPASAKSALVDADHPPVYSAPPVINAVAYSPDGKTLAVSGYHEVLLWSADGTNLLGRLVGLSERVQSVVFSPDGKYLAVTGGDPGRFGEVQLWDVAKKKLKSSLPITFDTVYGASWSPDSKTVAFGCADNSLRAIDVESGKQVLFQGGHNDWVLETTWSLKGKFVISVSRDRTMKLTELATQRLEDNITSITPGALKGGLQSVDRHPMAEQVVCGGADGTPKLYQNFRTKPRQIGDDFNLIRPFPPMPGRIFAVRFDAKGDRIAAGSSFDGKGEVHVYQVKDATLIKRMQRPGGPVYTVAFRPDGLELAAAGFDGLVRLYDPVTGQLLRQFMPVPLGKK
jgi:dipeptidyl aminopeptidase/acylaminoacyl peptidase